VSNIDQFESVFRAASREIYQYEKASINKVMIVTDLEAEEMLAFETAVKKFIKVLGAGVVWETISGDDSKRPDVVLKTIEESQVDLVVTYRNLHSDYSSQIYSLGTHLDMMSQKASAAVLVMPHPKSAEFTEKILENTNHVMAITDHLNGDCRLVNMAACFTASGGVLRLSHVEDEKSFEHVMTALSQIPEIDTDKARELISHRLLKDPTDYIATCTVTLAEAGVHLTVEQVVQFGCHLSVYRQVIEEHQVDLLVMHAKDEDQMAMHGLAYPLAVEFRHVPLLML